MFNIGDAFLKYETYILNKDFVLKFSWTKLLVRNVHFDTDIFFTA